MISIVKPLSRETSNDAELVGASLAGNRDAFGQIVARYQSLICSLAYSATGSLSQSEDLAQETFLAAWKQLAALQEPMKLRSWLCGIARNLINNSVRRQVREPSHQAGSLEEISEAAAPEPLPAEQSISNEEQAILWRSLERIPKLYREPLVLFYREHQSIEAVAKNLDLNEDTVKQRLSRGRKLLHEQVLAFVEGVLEKTSPGKTFTVAVIASLPLVATSAKAVTLGAALAQGGSAAKGVMTFGPLSGFFLFIGGLFYSLKGETDESKSPRERQFIIKMIGVRMVIVSLILTAFFLNRHYHLVPTASDGRAWGNLIISYAAALGSICLSAFLVEYTSYRQRQIQILDGNYKKREWEVARKLTEKPGDSARPNYFRTARFKGFMLILVAFFLMAGSWQAHPINNVLVFLMYSLCLYLDYNRWMNNPRFFPKGREASFFVVGLGLFITLFHYNFLSKMTAYLNTSDAVAEPTLATAILFNLAVVAVYGMLFGIILWWRKTLSEKLTVQTLSLMP